MASIGGAGDKHPGMMGDGTEEQNLDQPGRPEDRIKQDEVADAFGGKAGDGEADGDKAGGDKAGGSGTADPAEQPKDNSHNFT